MDMNFSKLRVIVENREAWRAAVHGVAKSRTRLSDGTTKGVWGREPPGQGERQFSSREFYVGRQLGKGPSC